MKWPSLRIRTSFLLADGRLRPRSPHSFGRFGSSGANYWFFNDLFRSFNRSKSFILELGDVESLFLIRQLLQHLDLTHGMSILWGASG